MTKEKKIIILMGSKSDQEHSTKIAKYLEKFGINYEFKVASAHFTPLKLLEILKEYENKNVIYITVAGKLDFLSSFVSANTNKVVISCPPLSERFNDLDLFEKILIFASQQVPSGAEFGLAFGSKNAVLSATRILAIDDKKLKKKLQEYIENKKSNRMQ